MTTRLELEVRAINGAGPETAIAELTDRSIADRLRGSAAILGFGLVVGLLFLPIPLIHIFGLMVVLACGIFAFKRFRVRTLVQHVAGTCPSCSRETRFFAGGGLLAARWPLASQCGACGIGVRLYPASAPVRGAGVVR